MLVKLDTLSSFNLTEAAGPRLINPRHVADAEPIGMAGGDPDAQPGSLITKITLVTGKVYFVPLSLSETGRKLGAA